MKKHLVSAHDLNKDEAVLVLDTAKELALISDRPVKKLPTFLGAPSNEVNLLLLQPKVPLTISGAPFNDVK